MQLVSVFLERHGDKKIDSDGQFLLNSVPRLVIGCWESNRQTVLAEFGDAFGRNGWTRELSYNEKEYAWKKIVDGVEIYLVAAEIIPPPQKPEEVSTKEFPLQLTNG